MADRKRSLRAVGPDEVAPSKPVESVSDAAAFGTRLDELVQMRRVIARALDDEGTSARDLAALSRRQIEISKEIEVLRAREQEADGHVEVTDEEFDASAI